MKVKVRLKVIDEYEFTPYDLKSLNTDFTYDLSKIIRRYHEHATLDFESFIREYGENAQKEFIKEFKKEISKLIKTIANSTFAVSRNRALSKIYIATMKKEFKEQIQDTINDMASFFNKQQNKKEYNISTGSVYIVPSRQTSNYAPTMYKDVINKYGGKIVKRNKQQVLAIYKLSTGKEILKALNEQYKKENLSFKLIFPKNNGGK